MFLKSLLAVLFTVASSQLNAQSIQNIFPEFTAYFSDNFVGKTSSGKKSWDDTECIVPNPFGGCAQKGGSKVEGSSTVAVSNFIDSWGTMELARDPFENNNLVKSNATVVFNYEGKTIGRRYSVPGNVFVEHAWGWLEPKGKIIIRVESSSNSYYTIHVNYEVLEGHGDRPNSTVENAAYNLKFIAKDIIQNFLRSKNVASQIIMN